ncbi:MAG: helix-turn-helix domain-containing protein [Acidobacteriota bacterium]
MSKNESIRALINLGFTPLEAEVYTVLVRHAPTTGYRIAQLIGKPAANTYKALESLHSKGAILIDEGENRICRAVPVQELLQRLEKDFRENKKNAEMALRTIESLDADDRIYQIRSAEQVFERCRMMLQSSRQIAIIDIFPSILDLLSNEISATVTRGVNVAIKTYLPVQIKNVDIFLDPFGKQIIERWPGQWVNMVIDGKEYLQAFLTLDSKDVHQAIWSGSAYLASVYHSAIAAELIMTYLHKRLKEDTNMRELHKETERFRKRLSPRTLGYEYLLQRFGIEGKDFLD